MLFNKKSSAVRELVGGGVSSQGMAGIKAPYFNVTFSLPLPAGVNVSSSSSSPKVATTPTVIGGLLPWPLNLTLKPGGKFKVLLRMSANNCTTPSDLPLFGQFQYVDSVGPKKADACLRKKLYVWADSCPAIPKAGSSSTKQNKQVGLGPKESWNQCNCNACKCNGKTCACPQNGCNCTAIP